MATGFRKYVPALLLSAFVVNPACSDRDPLTGPTSTTGLQGPPGALVRVEPDTTRAQFLFDRPCPSAPTFGVRVVVILSDRIVIARRLRFELTHHLGRPAEPIVFPLLTPATTAPPVAGVTPLPTPTQSPIPIPSVPALPTPGSRPIEDVLLSARRLPVFLEFGCGVAPAGTLVASVDTTDSSGRSQTAIAQVHVRE
jgi:hypothetical protein